jgi:hypothetical protein
VFDRLNKTVMLLESLTSDEDTPLLGSHPIPFPFLFVDPAPLLWSAGVATSDRNVALSFVAACLAADAFRSVAKLRTDSADFRTGLSKSYKFFQLAAHHRPDTLDDKLVHPMLAQHYEHLYSVAFEIMYWNVQTTRPPAQATVEQLQSHMENLSRIFTSVTAFAQYHTSKSAWHSWCVSMLKWTRAAMAVVTAAWLYSDGHGTLNKKSCASTAKMLTEVISLCAYANMGGLREWIVATEPLKERRKHYELDDRNYVPIYVDSIITGDLFRENDKPALYIRHRIDNKGLPMFPDLIDGFRRFKWKG